MSKLSLFTFIVCIYHAYNEICIMQRKLLCQLLYDTPDITTTIFFICRGEGNPLFLAHQARLCGALSC